MGNMDIDKKLGEGAMVCGVGPFLQMLKSFMPVDRSPSMRTRKLLEKIKMKIKLEIKKMKR